MKKIYLHIGCGKTGSSALQLWLNNSSQKLFEAGIYYPTFGAGTLPDYKITAGNGQGLVKAVSAGKQYMLLKQLKSESDGRDILLSSETFQSLDKSGIDALRDAILKLELKPVVIVYVRDVYEMLYSGYLQLIKRNLYTKTFNEFALSLRRQQQFDVLQRWAASFSNVIVKHYDSEKAHLDKSFCEALNLSEGQIPTMERKKVNRSLSFEEAELLRYLNALYMSIADKPSSAFSAVISNAMIAADQEAETPVLLSQRVLDHLSATFKDDIDWINRDYFDGKSVLRVSGDTAHYCKEIPVIPDAVRVALNALFLTIATFKFKNVRETRKHVIPDTVRDALNFLFLKIGTFKLESAKETREHEVEALQIDDTRIVDVLRDEAIRRENFSLQESVALMRAAKVLRPNGPVITNKLAEYEQRISLLGG